MGGAKQPFVRVPLTYGAVMIVAAFLVTSMMTFAEPVGADSDAEAELVERYAPILALRPQSEPCDTSAEQYAPADANIVLDNPHMLLRQVGVGNPVVKVGPTAQDIHDMGEGFYIDFPGDAFKPDCLFERDFHRYNQGANAVVYAHVATQADEPEKLAVQYWLFWYYNRYNNLHEGDWEGIQLMFDVGSAEEALRTEPSSLGLSQHFGGEVATWGENPESKLELVGTHPVIYPAVGSHASYFEPTLYLGRSGSQGFGCDDTQDATLRLEPDVVLLPDEVTDADDPLAWLMFEGLWGEQRFGPFSGATGPITKPRWTQPVDWHETLRTSSVAVPGGSETTTPYIKTFCTVVGFGSRQYLTAQQNPLRTSLLVGALGMLLFFLTGRTRWNRVEALPVVQKRRLGQMLTTAASFYWRHKRVFGGIGACYILASGVSTMLTALASFVLEPLGLLGAAVTGLVAFVGQLTALIAIGAATTQAAGDLQRTGVATVKGSFGGAAANGGTLFLAVARATVVVVGLAVTIVGIPWAIRQYVRYQVATPIIILEGQSNAEAALHESSLLIRGRRRWLHTALVVAIVQGLVALASAVFGLGFLIVANGLPLWLYSGVTTASSALVLPFSALAVLMLYGNVKAETLDRSAGSASEGLSSQTE